MHMHLGTEFHSCSHLTLHRGKLWYIVNCKWFCHRFQRSNLFIGDIVLCSHALYPTGILFLEYPYASPMVSYRFSQRKWVWTYEMMSDVEHGSASSKPADFTSYSITFNTADEYDAGTTAHVYLAIQGELGATGEINIRALGDAHSSNAFTSGASDTFRFQCSTGLGRLTSVRVRHDNSGSDPAWLLESVRIVDEERNTIFTFPCLQWLAGTGDCKNCGYYSFLFCMVSSNPAYQHHKMSVVLPL